MVFWYLCFEACWLLLLASLEALFSAILLCQFSERVLQLVDIALNFWRKAVFVFYRIYLGSLHLVRQLQDLVPAFVFLVVEQVLTEAS